MADNDTVFTPETAEAAAEAQGTVIQVNGEVKGSEPDDSTIGSVAADYARRAGLASFSVLADGVKVSTGDAGKPLGAIKVLNLVAKDARG